jgi:hypothetical protein
VQCSQLSKRNIKSSFRVAAFLLFIPEATDKKFAQRRAFAEVFRDFPQLLLASAGCYLKYEMLTFSTPLLINEELIVIDSVI